MNVAAILAASAALAAGADAASVVVVRDHAAIAQCQALGEVRGSSMMGGILANAAYDKAIRQIKEKSAALGGTHVQIVDSASGYSGARIIGTAFKCAPADPTPTP